MRAGRRWYALAFGLLLLLEALIAVFVHDRFVRPYLGDVLAAVLLYCLARAVGGRAPAWAAGGGLPGCGGGGGGPVFSAGRAAAPGHGAGDSRDSGQRVRLDGYSLLCRRGGTVRAVAGGGAADSLAENRIRAGLREGGRTFPELFVFMACPKSEPPAESNAFSRRFSAAL